MSKERALQPSEPEPPEDPAALRTIRLKRKREHPLLHKRVGNYLLTSLIADGGMASVFQAKHHLLGHTVAIKILETFRAPADYTRRFCQEAKVLVELDHPNIVRMFDFGNLDDGSLYLVMELLEGRSLRNLMQERRLYESEVARIAVAIASGLSAVHQQNVVHRDLKPGNIFLCADGVKLLDFGVAKVQAASSQTQVGMLVGTPHYMAPEQIQGSRHLGPQTDIYSLGVLLFEMMTGRVPFDSEDMRAAIGAHIFQPPPRPRSLVAMSEPMESLILQCLEKNPQKRPPTMSDVRHRLLRLMEPSQVFTTVYADPPLKGTRVFQRLVSAVGMVLLLLIGIGLGGQIPLPNRLSRWLPNEPERAPMTFPLAHIPATSTLQSPSEPFTSARAEIVPEPETPVVAPVPTVKPVAPRTRRVIAAPRPARPEPKPTPAEASNSVPVKAAVPVKVAVPVKAAPPPDTVAPSAEAE